MTNQKPQWAGRPILDHSHAKELDTAAAVEEFHNGHDRKTAEHRAYLGYLQTHHARAAAHHLSGMRASQAARDPNSARQHYQQYARHLAQLGISPNSPVPAVVKKYAEDPKNYGQRYQDHKADIFLPQDPNQK